MFITSQRNPIPVSSHSSNVPGNDWFTFCLWVCLLWTVHVSGIICYMAFYDRLLLLGKMFSSFIHVVAWINISFLLWMNNVCVSHSIVSNSCDPMNCGLPVSSVQGILQARILNWVVISSSSRFSQPRDRTHVSHIAGGRFTVWATREATWMNNIPLYWYTTCCLLISWVDRCLGCFPLFWLLWILLQWTFIYGFFFHLLFLAALGLGALCRLFSDCSEWGILSSCGVWASRCSGFSCEARAVECMGFSSCGSRALAHRLSSGGAQTGLVVPRHVWSSRIRDWTWVSCIGRQILYHWATREASSSGFCMNIYFQFSWV